MKAKIVMLFRLLNISREIFAAKLHRRIKIRIAPRNMGLFKIMLRVKNHREAAIFVKGCKSCMNELLDI